MTTRTRFPLAAIFMGLLLLCLPLKAQLDPKLQTSNTDFLNLYQQSTSLKVKPEVLTIFDFSGSMEALMYHPLFVNNDTTDADAGRRMTFALSAGTCTLTATSTQNSAAYATWTITNGVATLTSTGSQFTKSGSNYLYTTVTGTVTPSGTLSGSTAYTFSATVNLRATNSSGTAINLSSYGSGLKGGLTWAVSAGTRTPTTTSATVTTSVTTWTSAAQSSVWTVPALVAPGVTATLDPRAGTTISGNTYLTSTLTSTILVKPDGSQVTSSDAAAATSSTIYGSSAGASDVRNWLRAASHVRFAATVDGKTRTIDIPIPWKITTAASSGSPLSSYTVLDREIKTAADGTVTTYGSGNNQELDTTYGIDYGSQVFSASSGSTSVGTNSTQTSTTLLTVIYKAAYVSWLFNGKYLNGTYAGDYVVFDAANLGLAGGQDYVDWGKGYGSSAKGHNIYQPTYNLDGSYNSEITIDASANIVPALSRVQAVKRAAISTWIKHQADVLWAFRFLDAGTEANGGSATTINNKSTTTFNVTAGAVSTYKIGCDSAWSVLNNTSSQGITSTSGNSVVGMGRIAALFADPATPLTYAMARGLAQFTDPSSVFNAVEPTPSQCENHFLILFTDGIDNNGTSPANANTDCPYYIASGSTYKISALTGNHSVIATPASLNRNGSWWNMFTFAGVAAHLGDKSLGTTLGTDFLNPILPTSSVGSGTSAVPSSFLPLSIYQRNTTIFLKPHLITTMTVGVSLGGRVAASGPKRSLFITAAVGDPTITEWSDTSTLVPFKWDATANSGNGGRVSGSLYFFDATDPDKLSNSMDYAIISAIGASNINTASAPTTPFIGSALGGEMFIGKFQPPTNGGSIWTGDLLMFATKLVSDNLEILDHSGAVTTTVDTSTAQWSAYDALSTHRNWKLRTLYTRLAGTATTPNPGLSVFSDTGTPYTATTTGLQNFVCRAANNPNRAMYTVGSTAQQQVMQWVQGGDITNLDASSGRALTNRSNIMGDIIDSSPAVIEYRWGDVSSSLPTALSAVGGNHFRLILVGTNQGWLHAFGEVTKQDHAVTGDTTTPLIAKGAVDELWSFMPTDFLGYLDQLMVTSNPHRFMVDGGPTIYHLDLPPTSGGAADGVVEVSTSPGPERAMVIFGLGKGGRSYYALDIHDPYNPALKWTIIPDEVDVKDASGNPALQARILSRPGAPSITTVQNVIRNMGFSTCTPAVGRITLTDSTGYPVVRDAVFLGGGFSVPEVEANFLDANSKPTPMGRSILAVDASSGLILAAVDLSSTTTNLGGNALTPGPIYRGLVPFEFILNSGMAQRAYFLDFWGGLWAWGSMATDSVTTSSTYQYRMDSSDLSTWTTDGTATGAAGLRLVAKDISGSLITASNYTTPQLHYSEALYSTMPAPFRVGSFPGRAKVAGGPTPATVGIAIVSGDRNNPLDYYYTASTIPSHHRVSLVFDRQDSLAWGSVANPISISASSSAMLDAYPGHVSYQAGNALITPNSSTYFLAPTLAANTRFGFFANFPDMDSSLKLIPKGINTPIVVSGSLFYSYFFPTEADPCTGGTGVTYSNLLCDTLNPIFYDTRTNMSCTSGNIWKPVGVASDYIPLGTRGVIQIGTTSVANPTAGASATTLSAKTITGQSSARYPKARVWRTVH